MECALTLYIVFTHRKIGMELFGEVIYMRYLSESLPNGRPGKRAKGILDMIKTTVQSHGFAGWLGLCLGHPLLTQKVVEIAKASSMLSLEAFMEKASQEDSGKSVADLLGEWRKLQEEGAKPVEEIDVGQGESGTCASSITAPSPVSLPLIVLHAPFT